MAIYSFSQSYIGRSAGRSAVAAAAYRHSARMEVEQTGSVADYSKKGDTVHSEVAIPENAPAWIIDEAGIGAGSEARHVEGAEAVTFSARLWNRVEAVEKRLDAQLARDTMIALPAELSVEENIALVRSFIAEQVTAKGYVADWAFHLPDGAEHNPHVHLLTTLRPLTEEGFGSKAVARRDDEGNIVYRNNDKHGRYLTEQWAGGKRELHAWREGWANEANLALARAGFDRRIDHRSFADQGIDWMEPTRHHGPARRAGMRGEEAGALERDAITRSTMLERFRTNPLLVLERITHEKATFDDRDIARLIHRYADTREDFDNLRLRVGALPELQVVQAEIHDPETNRVVQRPRYTTSAMLEREATMIEQAQSRLSDTTFGVKAGILKNGVRRAERAQGFDYTPEQRGAIIHLTNDRGLGSMIGFAGAGKSAVMRGVAEVYRDADHAVVGAALSGKASEGLEGSSGIASRTLASWQRSWDNGYAHLEKGDVFVLDEAGMVPSREMASLVERLDQWEAKLVLVGDSRQLQPIEAGAAFRAIAEEAGTYELTEIRRQHTSWQAEASIAFGLGKTGDALSAYRDHGRFQIHEARNEARDELVADWITDWRAGADVQMFAHANRDVQALNALARSAIKEDGGIADDVSFVTARGPRQFAAGDRVIFLSNDRDLGIKNGTLGSVAAAEAGKLSIDVAHLGEPVEVDQALYNHIDHSYALTIHKTQGSTVDRAHVLATGTMDAQLSYVGLTRHREDVTVHVARDSFTAPWAKEAASDDTVFERLARYNAKDSTLDFRLSDDYAMSRDEIAAGKKEKGLARFLDLRGLPSPSEVRERIAERIEQLKAFVGVSRDNDDRHEFERQVPEQAAFTDLPRDLVPTLMHVSKAQARSDAAGGIGDARRERNRAAETAFYHAANGPRVRIWAEDVAAAVSPSRIASMSGIYDEQEVFETFGGKVSPDTFSAIRRNWRPIHVVSRAMVDMIGLETAQALDRGYRDERLVHDYQRGIDAVLEPEQAGSPPPVEPETLFAGATIWAVPFEQAVEQRVGDSRALQGAEQSAVTAAGRVWRDPEAVYAALRPQLQSKDGISALSRRIVDDPDAFGEIKGTRNWLGRPDPERQKALANIDAFSSQMNEVSRRFTAAFEACETAEKDFRSANRLPLDDLSPDARKTVDELLESDRLHRDGNTADARLLSREALSGPGWQEVRAWSDGIARRLPNTGDIERLPGMSVAERRRLSDTVQSVSRAQGIGEQVERDSAFELQRARVRTRDLGVGFER